MSFKLSAYFQTLVLFGTDDEINEESYLPAAHYDCVHAL